MSDLMKKLLYSFSILIVLLGFGYKQWLYRMDYNMLNDVIKTLHKYENISKQYEFIPNNTDRMNPKVAVGLGACMDVFVKASDLWQFMQVSPPERIASQNAADAFSAAIQFNEMEDITRAFVTFFEQGAAAERYIHNITLFQLFVDALEKMPDVHWTLGGNAPVMANRFAKEECDVILGARLNQRQINYLHPNVTYLLSNSPREDIHIIMEYEAGTQWGDYVAPRANRFIIHSDQENPLLGSLEDWPSKVKQFHPDLIVISSLQVMDNYPFDENVMETRLDSLRRFLSLTQPDTRIHFEMASFVDDKLMLELMKNVLPYTDSLGMNEQELPNLLSALEEGYITTISTAYPRLAVMLDQLRRVWNVLNTDHPTGTLGEGRRKLSRIHLHTLAYQVIMNKRGSKWTNTRRAVAKASLVAHRHACHSTNIDVAKSKLLMDDSFAIFPRPNSPRVHFNSTEPVACWEEGDIDVCVAPVLVCTKVSEIQLNAHPFFNKQTIFMRPPLELFGDSRSIGSILAENPPEAMERLLIVVNVCLQIQYRESSSLVRSRKHCTP